MDRIIVFGVGAHFKYMMYRGAFDNYKIVAFCDNDSSKWGTEYKETRIISPKDIEKMEYDFIIIATDVYEKEIRNQLMSEYGIDASCIKHIDIPNEKYVGEVGFWRECFDLEGNEFDNRQYKELMLSIAEEVDDSFWENKVVADFGCGPKGSLSWTTTPKIKIGIDVLVPQYLQYFGKNMIEHGMVYVTSSEEYIPIPSNSVDYLITTNSLDHVVNLEKMCGELLRILKPEGTLLASFNLFEPASECEPQSFTEEILDDVLLKYFDIQSYRKAYKNESNEDTYINFFNNKLIEEADSTKPMILWVRAKKKGL